MLDMLITNGLIIDGTGSPGYLGAVGVEGDAIRLFRGDLSSVEAARTIDAAKPTITLNCATSQTCMAMILAGNTNSVPEESSKATST